jgi:hypothetical protein
MATWKADIKTTPTGSIYSVTVEAGASYVAKEEIERLYRPIFIRNLREVRNSSNSNSGDSEGNLGAAVGLVGLIAAGWAFMTFTPWILMGLGGAGAAWIGQKVTGQTIEEYNEREDGKGNKRIAFVLIMTLLAGGFGFIKGDEIKKGFDAPNVPAEVNETK